MLKQLLIFILFFFSFSALNAQRTSSCVTSTGLVWHFEDLKDHHEAGLLKLFKDPEVDHFFLGKKRPEDALYHFLERARNVSSLYSYQYDFIKLMIHDSQVIGMISMASNLPTWFSKEERVFLRPKKIKDLMVIGYSVLGKYRRQGLAKQALEEMLDYVHTIYGRQYFGASVNSQNLGSQAFLEKMGFRKLPNEKPLERSDRFFLDFNYPK